MPISEDELKKSFARVKEDIIQVKRSLNKQLFSLESLSKSSEGSLQKEEFYAFVKRLGSRIEELENNFVSKSDKEDLEELGSEIKEELSALGKAVERRDELAEEVRQSRNLRGKVLELEGTAVSRPEFAGELAKLKTEISGFKATVSSSSREASSLSGLLSKLKGDLSGLNGELNSMSAKVLLKDDLASFTDRMESSHQEVTRGFSSLKRDLDKKVSEIDKKVASVASVEEAIAELRSKLGETKQLLESSMSEVNLDDYVTKRSVKQQLSSASESVSSGIMSDVSSRMESIEGQLKSLKDQFSKELPKFAGSKELKRLNDEFGRLSSGFVSSSEFNSKVGKLESSGAADSDDFKKEIRKQRELFEERLRSLESYYRSSNDNIKAQLEELNSNIKSLSKADAQARTEMAKITVTAAKAAAKSAADILDEIEKEPTRNGEEGSGFSPLIVALIILGLLLAGSVSYVFIKGPGKMQNLTVITPIPPLPSAENSTNKSAAPGVVGQQNTSPVSNPVVLPETNKSQISNVPAPVSKAQECKGKLECTERGNGEYWFDCYFDDASNECRCYTGSIANCPNVKAANATVTGNLESKPKLPSAKYFGFVAFVLVVVAFLAFRTLFVKDEDNHATAKRKAGEESPKDAGKGKGLKIKELEKVEDEEDDIIDLEEFFEKKDSKKK